MDSFTMPDSAMSADKSETKKEFEKLNKRVEELEGVVAAMVFLFQKWSENQTNSDNP